MFSLATYPQAKVISRRSWLKLLVSPQNDQEAPYVSYQGTWSPTLMLSKELLRPPPQLRIFRL